jgi:hypothetical protein
MSALTRVSERKRRFAISLRVSRRRSHDPCMRGDPCMRSDPCTRSCVCRSWNTRTRSSPKSASATPTASCPTHVTATRSISACWGPARCVGGSLSHVLSKFFTAKAFGSECIEEQRLRGLRIDGSADDLGSHGRSPTAASRWRIW